MNWQKKKILEKKDLSQKLQEARLERGLLIKQVTKVHYLPGSFIRALEEGDYNLFPEKVYATALLKKYLAVLQLPIDEYVNLWQEEWIHWQKLNRVSHDKKKDVLSPFKDNVRFALTPAFWQKSFLLFFGLISITYIGWRVAAATSPLELVVREPADGLIIQETSVQISGIIEQEAQLTINGQEVELSLDGSFAQLVNLQLGLNILELTASKKYRPSVTLTRQILVTE